jgi:small subunit ribosomal protein S17
MAKTFTGVVASDRGDKTIVVAVATRKTHPIYKKQYTISKRFMAHDEQNEAKLGDTVNIVETKPLSARKRFALVKVIERAAIRHEEAVETEPTHDSKKKTAAEEAEEKAS